MTMTGFSGDKGMAVDSSSFKWLFPFEKKAIPWIISRSHLLDHDSPWRKGPISGAYLVMSLLWGLTGSILSVSLLPIIVFANQYTPYILTLGLLCSTIGFLRAYQSKKTGKLYLENIKY